MFGCFWNQLTDATLPFAVLLLTFVIMMSSKTSPIPQCRALTWWVKSQRARVITKLAPALVTAARRKSFRRNRKGLSFTCRLNHLLATSSGSMPNWRRCT
jgi:hypothetical protein